MAITSTFGKKAAAAALVALTLGAGMTANSGAAEARWGRHGGARHGGGGVAAVGAFAAIAGMAIAASAAQAHAAPQYYGQYDGGYDNGYAGHQQVYYRQQQPVYEDQGYYQPQPYRQHRRHYNRNPGYSETGFAYRGPVCKIKRQQVFDGYGYRWQKVQVCR